MLQLQTLILKLITIYGLATLSIALGDVTTDDRVWSE